MDILPCLCFSLYIFTLCFAAEVRSEESIEKLEENLLSLLLQHNVRSIANNGEECQLLLGIGLVKSPNYPMDYENNVHKCYVLRAREGKVPQLTFRDFELAGSSCSYDYVEVTSGSRTEKYCGDTAPEPIVGTTREMTVHFVTSRSNTARGFAAMFTSVDRGSEAVVIDEDTCGVLIDTEDDHHHKKIVGGQPAEEFHWPWMASLRYGENTWTRVHKCAATIVSDRWFITAAHCVVHSGSRNPMPTSHFALGTGEYTLITSSAHGHERTYDIDEIIVHPNYDSPNRYSNDVALIKTSDRIKIDRNRIPACLPDRGVSDPHDGQECMVLGWGTTTVNARFQASSNHVMNELEVPIVDQQTCDQWYSSHGGVDSTMICAGYRSSGKGPCRGDSGGPLLCQKRGDSSGRWFLFGVVSWGDVPCAQARQPTVFARITQYRSWIQDQTNDEVTLED